MSFVESSLLSFNPNKEMKNSHKRDHAGLTPEDSTNESELIIKGIRDNFLELK